jgi:hypothetical protein
VQFVILEDFELQINTLDWQLRKLEAKFQGIQDRGGGAIYHYLQYLGIRGVMRLTTDQFGPALIPPGDLRETWDYQIGDGWIQWANVTGDQIKGEVNRNLVTHFLDEGTVAHGPAVAKWLHFFGTKEYAGQEFFLKWVSGIKPRYIFLQLAVFIEDLHEQEWEAFITKLFD